MWSCRGCGFSAALGLLLLGPAGLVPGQESAIDQAEFFENRIRPVLVEHCYPCHNSSGKAKGGLAVDHRAGIRQGADYGAAVVPGDPDESLLLEVIRHEIEDLEMPKDGPKLGDEVIADFERWIRSGAHDPRDTPPDARELAAVTSWTATLERRKQWWSLQPIRSVELPAESDWATHPIDRFVERGLMEHGLTPGQPADRRTLIRRMTFAVTGLPPTSEEIERYLADENAGATERLIDRLLAQPQYGERWARHWMDLVRYADSHGSEGDPTIPEAYRYRDYLIRAFNADVPYDQFVREHVAGDLLVEPRIDEELGLNESAIGTAHWRMVFHGFAPTDALDEKVRFTDDQINVFGKTFLATTISCARCHDHKFDAVSQADYTALFGILGSCRPAMQDVSEPRLQALHSDELERLKHELRSSLSESWLTYSEESLTSKLTDTEYESAESTDPSHALHLIAEVDRMGEEGVRFAEAWERLRSAWEAEQESIVADDRRSALRSWDFRRAGDTSAWFRAGNGLTDAPSRAGDFAIEPDGERAVTGIYPAGVYSHLLSSRHRGVFESPRVQLTEEAEVWLLVAGGGQARIRYVVQNYPRSGTVFPIADVDARDSYWHKFDLGYWTGDQVHFEVTTARDAPLEVRARDRSWWGLRRVVVRAKGAVKPAGRSREYAQPIFELAGRSAPESRVELIRTHVTAVRGALEAWRDGSATDSQALLLDACVRDGLLPNTLSELPGLAPRIAAYRRIEADVPLPTRVPGLAEADAYDHPLYDRGNHKRPLAPVPRRFLEAIDERPYGAARSGRLQLAGDLVRPDNPLTARVIVNRIWYHLIGRGIVATPDNFGRLGALPSHPELLDLLALRMVERGWSIKDTIRFILSSKTWQLDSRAEREALEMDPDNRWLSHANVRRLDAESIRDSMLAVSGELDVRMFGPGFQANSAERRRSVYVQSRRNSLDQFLQAFDAPVPFAPVGRRASTNVPAQSLALLNDPFVMELASSWGASALRDPVDATNAARIVQMFSRGLGREPTSMELGALREYRASCAAEIRSSRERRGQLETQISLREESREALLGPARERLLASLAGSNAPGPAARGPIHQWDFRESLDDGSGALRGTLHGSARLAEGGLVLDGNGHVSTPPLDRNIEAKTLEAWVRLDDLDQRGGGVMTIQDLRGDVFDSIVFAERIPGRWLAGSNNFQRTEDFRGYDEAQAADAPVHVAIAYDADGTIRGYRHGAPYGEPYRKSPLAVFTAGDSQILFGLRHGEASGGRLLRGRILEARLYDWALTPEEIRASFAGRPVVTRAAVLGALEPDQRVEVEGLEAELAARRRELQDLGDPLTEESVWGRIAHAVFNLKEFLYIR